MRKNTILRLFWTLIVLCGLCGSGYMTVLFWERYTSNPTRTTVLNAYAPTTAIPFPAVTICNVNIIFLSKVEAFIKELDLNGTDESILKSAFTQLVLFIYPNVVQYNITELNILQNILSNNGYDDTTLIMKKFSQDCEEMLLYCLWNKQAVPCADIFEKTVSRYGICCSFNYDFKEGYQNLYNPFSGMGTGLMVLLNPMLQPVQYSSLHCTGFKVIIHNPGEYLGSQCDSKLLSNGRSLYIQIEGTKMTCSKSVKNLPISQRGCLYPDELNLKYFRNGYTVDNCLVECESELYFQQCGCVPFYYPFRDKSVCNISKIPCLSEMKSSQMIPKKMKLCYCLPECEDVFYNIFSTSTNLNYYDDDPSMLFGGNTEFRNGTSTLNVLFLGDKHKILLKDTITSTIYLLSSFGGVYSLFMGCSLITIVEIVYYCFARFTFNMNAFGKVNIDILPEDTTRAKKTKNSKKPRQRAVYGSNYFGPHSQRFYYEGAYLP